MTIKGLRVRDFVLLTPPVQTASVFKDGFVSLHGVWRSFSSFLLLQPGVGWGFVLSLGTVFLVFLLRFQYFGGLVF